MAAGPLPISGADAKVIACQCHPETSRTPNVGAKDEKRRKKRSVRNGMILSVDLPHDLCL